MFYGVANLLSTFRKMYRHIYFFDLLRADPDKGPVFHVPSQF